MSKICLSPAQRKGLEAIRCYPALWDLIVAACREPGLLEREGLNSQPSKLFTETDLAEFQEWCNKKEQT